MQSSREQVSRKESVCAGRFYGPIITLLAKSVEFSLFGPEAEI